MKSKTIQYLCINYVYTCEVIFSFYTRFRVSCLFCGWDSGLFMDVTSTNALLLLKLTTTNYEAFAERLRKLGSMAKCIQWVIFSVFSPEIWNKMIWWSWSKGQTFVWGEIVVAVYIKKLINSHCLGENKNQPLIGNK